MKKKSSLRLRRNEIIQSYLMIAPSVLGLGLFVIYPILWVLRYALFSFSGIGEPFYVGFENFERLFVNSPRYWQAVGNTFVFAFGKLAIELPLALVCATLLYRGLKGRSFFRMTFFLPSMLSIAVMGIMFYYLFGSYNGVVNEIIMAFGGSRVAFFSEPRLAMGVIMIASVWENFGINMLFFMAGLQSIPYELYEASAIDGANRRDQFMRITLPMLGPVMQMVILNALLGSLKVAELIIVMTEGRPDGTTQMMMSYVFRQFFPAQSTSSANYGYGSVLVIMSAIILGIVTAIYLRSTRRSADII